MRPGAEALDGRTTEGRNQDLASALADAEARYVARNPESARAHALAVKEMPGGNTRTTVHFSPFPLCMARAEGPVLVDVDGHRYADFINEYTAGVFGHSNPVIAEAIRQALADGIAFGAPNRHEPLLAAEIRRRFPSMELVRFCNSGTEANLLALAACRAVTGKPAVMVFDGAYHGSMLYFGHGVSPMNPPIPWVVSTYNDLQRAEEDLARNAARLAAVVVEPMQGGAGAIPADPGFLRGLRAACDRHGVTLIFDEVMTSRLGPSGVQGLHGIRPDMTTLGKYVCGGLSSGAFGGRAEIMSRFDPRAPNALSHGGTFNNNVLGMAAGHAALTRVLAPERQDRMNRLGDGLRERLNAMAAKRGLPVRATGMGSIFGLHFHEGAIRNAGDLEAAEHGRETGIAGLKALFHLDMLEQGHYLSRRILGNLSLETIEAQLDALCAAVEEFLETRGPLIRAAVS